ncbi:DUF3558 family protein [Corynebacterium felinum]|uniref:DUF3558 domain-containing protein n=1 Tax=Corynebacterium felinum TaxID=131318 RepID=A0ABU2BAJ9_9CORY|nr:DUF3558 family protein [Corynebacterium felinum]MDF5819511.1 DUF3558 family protein [Corynebacterium felinum]MDR7355647.1 hypothetical protein [Corynebacterium felinum]WJY94998.1 hypothetical protein CFELI_06910 [Corynebacterium felinum]
MRTRILTALVACGVAVSGCAPPQDTQSAHSTTTEETYPFETWESPPKPTMIPLPPDREYVEAFDIHDRSQTLYDPCDGLTTTQLAEIGLEKTGGTDRHSKPLIHCGMSEINHIDAANGTINVLVDFVMFEYLQSLDVVLDATFPQVDKRIYFSQIDPDTARHCDASISTTHGRLNVTYSYGGDGKPTKDELCWKVYEILEKLRTKGNFT